LASAPRTDSPSVCRAVCRLGLSPSHHLTSRLPHT